MKDRPQPKDRFNALLEAFGGHGYRAGYLLWRGAPKYGTDRLDKVPCRPDNGAVPNIGNSPEAMAQLALEDAVACARKLDFDGRTAGVSMYCPKAGLYGVDLDNCVIDGRDGVRLAVWADELIGEAPRTYVELSPSGTGLRVILTDVPESIKRFMTGAERHDIGLYGPETRKHLTLTGHRLEGRSGPHIDRDDAMMSRVLARLAQYAAEKGRDVGSIMGRYPPGEKGMQETLDDIRTGTSLHDATVAYVAKAWPVRTEDEIVDALTEAYGISKRRTEAPGVWAERVDDIPGILGWVRQVNGDRPAGMARPLDEHEARRMREVVNRVAINDDDDPETARKDPDEGQGEDWTHLLPGQPHDPRPEPLDGVELEVVREAWGRLDAMTAAEHEEAWEVIRESRSAPEEFAGNLDRHAWRSSPEPEWVIDGWVPRGLLTTLFGGDGTGKSYIALSVAMRLAVGRPVLGAPAKAPMKVLFLSAEDPMVAILDRIRRFDEHFGLVPGELDLIERNLMIPELLTEDVKLMVFDRDGEHRLTKFGERVMAVAAKVDLIILDPISDIYEDEENVRQKVVAFMRQLIVMAAHNNIGALLIGHPSKAEDSEYSGSGAWSSKSRSRLFLQSAANGMMVELSQRKTSYGRTMQPVLWTWDDRGHPVEVAGEEMRATVRRDEARSEEDVVLAGMERLATEGQATSGDALSAAFFLPRVLIKAGYDEGYPVDRLAGAMRRLIGKGTLATDVMFDGKGGVPKLMKANRQPRVGVWYSPTSPF